VTLRRTAAWAGAPLLLWLCACIDAGVGYVEIKSAAAPNLPLYLDTTKIGALKNGTTVLRQDVGRSRLQLERNGQLVALCEFDVRRDRIVTLTLSVSAFDRTPRCEVRS
jgi:hypothetical protein